MHLGLGVVACAVVGPCNDFRPKQRILGKLGGGPIRVADYYTPTVCGKQEVRVPCWRGHPRGAGMGSLPGRDAAW